MDATKIVVVARAGAGAGAGVGVGAGTGAGAGAGAGAAPGGWTPSIVYLTLSASGSAFHIWPKVLSLSALRRLVGKKGRCFRQYTTYGFEHAFFAGGAAVGVDGVGLLGGAEVARGGPTSIMGSSMEKAGKA